MTLNRLLCSAVVAALLTPAVVVTADPRSRNCSTPGTSITRSLATRSKSCAIRRAPASPDLAAIKTAAKKVNDASVNQEKWFPAGTGPEAGKTQALADIWAKPDEFKAAMKMFSDAAPKLNAAANAGDVAAIKTAFGDVGKACKNCHDQFRAEDD